MMKPKDAGFFSLHIEKIILLLVLLFCAFLAMVYVISSPNTIEISGQTADADKASDIVARQAQRLRTALESDPDIPEIEDVSIPDYNNEFNLRLAATSTAVAKSFKPLAQLGTDQNLAIDARDDARYYLPTPPMAEALAVRVGNAVLDRMQNAEIYNDIITTVGTNDATNYRYASIKAEFPIDAWSKRLAMENISNDQLEYQAEVRDENGDPVLDENGNVKTETRLMQAMPKVWWQSNLAITSVMLEREELDPLTGKWVNRMFVQNMPTQIAFRSDDDRFNGSNSISKIIAQQTVQTIKARQSEIARSDFLPMAFPLSWLPPDAKKLTPEEEKDLYKIRKKIANYEKQLLRMQENMKKQQMREQAERSNPRANRTERSRTRSPRGNSGGMPMNMGAPTRRPTRSIDRGARSSNNNTIQDQMQIIQQKMMEAIEEREVLMGRKEKSDPKNPNSMDDEMYGNPYGGGMNPYGNMSPYGGMNPYGEMGPGYGDMGRRLSDAVESQYELKEDGTRVIKVWAHDVTAEPGKTYRYRVIVSMLNPLFAKHRVASAQKAANYYKMMLVPSDEEREASPWTEPVSTDPQSHFFLVGNSATNARVEIWALHEGKWLNEEFTFEPGDKIAGVIEGTIGANAEPVEIDVDSGAVIVDMIPASQGKNAQLIYEGKGLRRLFSRDANSDKDNDDRIRVQNAQTSYEELLLERDKDGYDNDYMDGMDMGGGYDDYGMSSDMMYR